jgi:hypothetical protein
VRFVLFAKYNENYHHVEEDEVVRACGMNGGEDECI